MDDAGAGGTDRSPWLWYQLAVACVGTTFVGGAGIVVLWLAVRADALVAVGWYWVGIGLLLLVCGAFCLVVFAILSRNVGPQLRKRRSRSLLWGSVLLTAHLLAAMAIVAVVVYAILVTRIALP